MLVVEKKYACLVDTGCELSLIPRKVVPKAQLHPTQQKIYAANWTEVPVLEKIRLQVKLAGLETAATLPVSEAVEEVMLGIDWLTEHECQWRFNDNILVVDGYPLRLMSRKCRVMCRKVYAQVDLVIPPGHQADVCARVTWTNLHTTRANLLLEPVQCGQVHM
jgi:predicted aspartyl protease